MRIAATMIPCALAACAITPPPVQAPAPVAATTYTTGGPPIPASGPCPAPTFEWQIRVHVGPGIDDRPLFTVTGKIALKHRYWAELREEYPLNQPAAPIYMVRLNVRMSPTEQRAGDRVIEVKNTQPVSTDPATVLVTCGSQVVARFEKVKWPR